MSPRIRCGLILSAQLVASSLFAGTSLDPQFFPPINRSTSDAPPAVVVQGNWGNYDAQSQGAKTGWLPVRLFGTTNAQNVTLRFSLTGKISPVPVTVRTPNDSPTTLGTDGSASSFEATVK